MNTKKEIYMSRNGLISWPRELSFSPKSVGESIVEAMEQLLDIVEGKDVEYTIHSFDEDMIRTTKRYNAAGLLKKRI